MTNSNKLLKKQLMKAKDDEAIGNLGFGDYTRLSDYLNQDSYFERLWVSKNKEGLEIVILDLGNSNAEVIGFLREFVEQEKVFNPEDYGYLTTYTNNQYHNEEEERWNLIKYALEEMPEGVYKIHDFKK